MNLEKDYFIKICSIEKEKNGKSWEFKDCNNTKLANPSTENRFSSAMNIRYRKLRNQKLKNYELKSFDNAGAPCVWILAGEKNENNKDKEEQVNELIQVGRTMNLTNLLSNDIKEDIKEFFSRNGKYAELSKSYNNLIFYEVKISSFMDEIKNILGPMPTDEDLRSAYLVNCAAYMEGKIAAENDAVLYHPSILDGCFYKYFKKKLEPQIGT